MGNTTAQLTISATQEPTHLTVHARIAQPGPLCLPQLVEAVAEKSPSAVALTAGPLQLTYSELNHRANQLAAHLVSLGVMTEVAVGICLPRSFDYIVAALAVWKAGGAYLPLDPAWPQSRRAFALKDSQAKVLITRGSGGESLQGASYSYVDLNRDQNVIANALPASKIQAMPTDLAYIIYTSGSTGQPKGVEVTHGNLLNLVDWHRQCFAVTPQDRASHLAGLAFDASVWEIWPYLSAGASIALADDAVRTSPDLLREWLLAERITISFVPTALAEPLLQTAHTPWPASTNHLRFLLTGADTLHCFPSPGLPFQLVNNYGPAECTVVATSGIVESITDMPAAARPSIGRPISNTQIYLLNDSLQLVAPGETGEIYIGGASVARGYRNHPELTLERFLPDPFSPDDLARIYRTGDLAALLPDGRIAFQGRADNQEKIRGFRVEPDEIVSVLTRHPLVKTAAVLARGPVANRQLVAYIVPSAENATDAESQAPRTEELREFLSRDLPEYMVPSSFVRMTELPLNANGKLDRAVLPEPTSENALDAIPYQAPQSPVEMQVADILGELLHHNRVGLDDNFFHMGGQSLLAAQLIVRLRAKFGVQLSLRDLFQNQTVAKVAVRVEEQLAAQIDGMSDEEASRILALLDGR